MATSNLARDAGIVSISPALLAFKEDIDTTKPLSQYAPPRDAEGNFLSTVSITEANPRVWAGSDATLRVLRDGGWVDLETVTVDDTGTAAFTPVAFTPELGDLVPDDHYKRGRMHFRIVMQGVDRNGAPITYERKGYIYRCLRWVWNGCAAIVGG